MKSVNPRIPAIPSLLPIALTDLPEPRPCDPVFNLTATTWGASGSETRRSRTASIVRRPVLGWPDPNPFEKFRLFGRWRR